MKSKDPMARFLEKVRVDEASGCWMWLAAKFWTGYGRFKLRGVDGGAHRASWTLHFGDIPAGAVVMHTCDVRACVNPAHLRLGTNEENMADMVSKGRQAHGRSHGRAKLTEEDALEIRGAAGRHRDIAHRFGISKVVVGYIKRGKLWAHLEPRP